MPSGELILRAIFSRAAAGRHDDIRRCPAERRAIQGACFLLASLTAAGISRSQDEPKQAAPQDDKRVVRIFGAVRDAANRPVADATVWLVDSDARAGYSRERVSETRSEADGAFSSYEVVDRNTLLDLVARDSQGRLGWNRSFIRPELNTIQLYEVCDVRGRVVDADGRPIGDARVAPVAFIIQSPGEQFSSDFTELFSELAAMFETRTAADGSFVLSKVPKRAHVRCEVSASGFGTPQALFAAKDPVTIKLQRAGKISGALGPLAGVEAAKRGYKLRVTRQQQKQGSDDGKAVVLNYSEELTTDDDGTFRSGDVPPGRYMISAVAGQGRPFFAHPATYAEVKPAETTQGVSVPLTPTARVTGRVVEHETHKGVAGVELVAYQPNDRGRPGESQQMTTDDDGRFEFRLPPSEIFLRIINVPREFLVPPFDFQNPQTRKIADGDEWPTFELSQAAEVEGLVIDDAAQPAPHAELHIDLRQASARPYDWLPRYCDGNGKFTIAQVDPNLSFSVRARTAEAVTDGVVLITASALKGPASVEVSKKHVFRLRGKVVDDAGLPLPGAIVLLQWSRNVHGATPPQFRRRLAGRFAFGMASHTSRNSELEQFATNADGKFESGVLWPGDAYQATISASGYANVQTSSIQGAPGDVHDFGTLVLKRNDLIVSGVVIDENGRAVADAEIEVMLPAVPSKPPLRSDRQGRFTVADIDASLPLALRARTVAATTSGATVVLPIDFAKPVKLVVAARHAFRLRGTVVDRQGKPAAGARVSVRWDRRSVERPERPAVDAGMPLTASIPRMMLDQVDVMAGGSFETPALWPDEKYHLVAIAPGFAPNESAIVYGPAGKITTLEPLVLTRSDLKISGRVVDSKGRPLAGASVLNSGDADKPLASTTDAHGRFTLEGLYEGPVHLLARLLDYRAAGWRGAAGGEPIEIVLSGADEPPARVGLARVDDPARFGAEKQLARRLLAELWAMRDRFDDYPENGSRPRVVRGVRVDQTDTAARLAQIMAGLDLDQALAWAASEGGRLDETVRVAAVASAHENDVERAVALLAGMKTYAARLALLAMARREIAAGKQEPTIRLLEAALAAAPSDASANFQNQDSDLATARAQVGALAIRAGRVEWGAKLLRQAADAAEKAAAGDEATRGQVAAAIAELDPERALRLLRIVQNNPRFANDDRYAVLAAATVAAHDLKQAREFLSLVQPGQAADRARMQVACRLADRDWKTALELVDETNHRDLWTKADALCWIAEAVAPRDPDQAYALVDRALELYFNAPLTGSSVSGGRPVEAARIAMAAHDVDYPNMPNVIDRVLALRLTYSGITANSLKTAATISTARVLALVDSAIARELLISVEPYARLIGDDDGGAGPSFGRFVDRRGRPISNRAGGAVGRGEWLQAWALADLDEAKRRCDEELAGLKQQSKIETASIDLLPLIELLVTPPSERERFMLRSIDPSYWFPGDDEP